MVIGVSFWRLKGKGLYPKVSCQVAELMAGEGPLNEGPLFRRCLVHILLGTLVRI